VKVVLAGVWHPCMHGKEEKGLCYHLEIGSKNQKFLEDLKSAA